MGRRRRNGRPVNGILVLDKPAGLSSNQALQEVKRLYGAAKAGHTGSLDPMATGVLPLCFGEATKFSQYLLDADKAYTSSVVLGVRHDHRRRGDGEVVSAEIADQRYPPGRRGGRAGTAFLGRDRTGAAHVLGTQAQGPAAVQAGPLRSGGGTQAAPGANHRRWSCWVSATANSRSSDIHLACSKGTYVRSLAEDIGASAGCWCPRKRACGAPRQVRSAIAATVSLQTLQALKDNGALGEMDALMLPLDAALGDLPMVQVSEAGGFYIRQGQPVLVPNSPCSGMVRMGLETGEFLGVGEILDDGRVAPRRLIVAR